MPTHTLFTRARRSRAPAAFALLLATLACDPGSQTTEPVPVENNGRLTARITAPTLTVEKGLSVQRTSPTARPFGVYIPESYDPATPAAVTVLLHGYGSSGEEMALGFKEYADSAGLIILAPNSRGPTWDLILSQEFGLDVTFIDNMLKWAFQRINVDPARMSISGFSDGATYSIWVGLKNGDLFTRLAAFTPCSTVPRTRTGMPTVFISHSTDDEFRPIEDCSRRTVPTLLEAGYDVEYIEYPAGEGNGHFMTPDVIQQGLSWLVR